MNQMMKKLTAWTLVLSMSAGLLGTTAFAADEIAAEESAALPNDHVMVETTASSSEVVDVIVSTEKKEDGTIETTAKTVEGGDVTDSGLIVTFESTAEEKPAEEAGQQPEPVSRESAYTVESPDGTYKAEGGSETVVETLEPGAEDAVSATVGLYDENGNLLQPSEEEPLTAEGSSGTADEQTTPTNEGDQTREENPAVYDQTTVTTTDRTVELAISSVEITAGQSAAQDNAPENLSGSYYWTGYHDVYGYEETTGYDYDWRNPAAQGPKNDPSTPEVDGFTNWATGRAYFQVVHEDGTVEAIRDDGTALHAVANQNGTPDDYSDDIVIGGLYCVDANTGLATGVEYQAVSLEDAVEAGYYDEEDAAHLRAVMSNGFVSHGDGKGHVTDNFDEFKAMLSDAKENGSDEVKALLAELDLDSLTRQQAVTATSMAVWQFGNRFTTAQIDPAAGDQLVIASNNNNVVTNADLIYKYLISLPAEYAEEEKEIISDDHFIDNVELVVGSMVQGEAANEDDDDDNDVYDVGLKFSLVVTPDAENDDLIVKVLDAAGNTVKEARIAGTAKENEELEYLTPDEDGSYLLSGMHLAEGSSTFNLKLEGTQYLEEGVYVFESEKTSLEEGIQKKYDTYTTDEEWEGEQAWVFQKKLPTASFRNAIGEELLAELEAMNGDYTQLTKETYMKLVPYLYFDKDYFKNADGSFNMDATVSNSQNLIGEFEGSAYVNVGMTVDLAFHVEEATVTTTREWRTESYYEPEEGGEETGGDEIDDGDDDNDNIIDDDIVDDEIDDEDAANESDIPEVDPPLTGDVPAELDPVTGEEELAPVVAEEIRNIPEEEVPLAEASQEQEKPQELEEIEEDMVPLGDVPATGDPASLMTVLFGLSGMGLAVLTLGKKKEQE